MAHEMQDHRMKMEAVLSRARLLEEEKENATLDYDLKNKRGLGSQMTNQTAKKAQKGKPPVSSGKAIFKSRAQMAAEAEAMMFGGAPADGAGDEDTFLTGLLAGKKQKSEGKRSATLSAQKPPKAEARSLLGDSEMNADDIESELRDVVFDYEGSKALVLAADNFLSEDTQSRRSGKSMRSGISSTTSKIHDNKANASKFDPFKIKLLQDRLSSPEKARLATLLQEIDENYDALMKEKAEYHRHGMKAAPGGYKGAGAFDVQSQASGQTGVTGASGTATGAKNAYIYS